MLAGRTPVAGSGFKSLRRGGDAPGADAFGGAVQRMCDFEPVPRIVHRVELEENLSGLTPEDREYFAFQMAIAGGLTGEMNKVEWTVIGRGLNALSNQHFAKVSF